MRDTIISVVAGLLATMFLNPKFEIIKINMIKRGGNIDKINNIYFIYIAVTTIVVAAIAYFIIWIFKFIISNKNRDTD